MAQTSKSPRLERSHGKSYLIGGGVASLAAAAFLIKEGGIEGKDIFIFEEREKAGGSLEVPGDADHGYHLLGGRMFEESFVCTLELLSFVPSVRDPARTAKQEILEAFQNFGWRDRARLVEGGGILDISVMGFSARDRLDISELFALPENLLGKKTINDWFKEDFFKTNFWLIWSTSFGFTPWHSVVEFKRYLLHFTQDDSSAETRSGIHRTQYNHYEMIVRPLVRWLAERGVSFELGCQVENLEFKLSDKVRTVEALRLKRSGRSSEVIPVNENDFVFVTNGSMSTGTVFGTMDSPPPVADPRLDSSWTLWETLAHKYDNLGHPATFNSTPEQSKSVSFTVTAKEPKFFELISEFAGVPAEEGVLLTLADSHWMLSVVLNRQPHFYTQPGHVWVWWGYGLYPDRVGNFVKKKMSDCSGREILTEVLSHFRFMQEIPQIMETSICLPCMMPFAFSPFLPREKGDRPLVVPKGSTNLAFIGQYSEVPKEVGFTVEYSVRSAQMAVYDLLGIKKELPPPHRVTEDLGGFFDAIRDMNRGPRPSEATI